MSHDSLFTMQQAVWTDGTLRPKSHLSLDTSVVGT